MVNMGKVIPLSVHSCTWVLAFSPNVGQGDLPRTDELQAHVHILYFDKSQHALLVSELVIANDLLRRDTLLGLVHLQKEPTIAQSSTYPLLLTKRRISGMPLDISNKSLISG